MDAVACLPTLDDLVSHVKAVLCEHDQLDPEQTPIHQALLVSEGLREAERANDHADPQLAAWLRAEAGRAEELHQSLQASRLDAATAAFKNLEAGCAQCHKQYRN